MERRERARDLAEAYAADGEPTEWFDDLYAEWANVEAAVSWADLEPTPNLVAWLDRRTPPTTGRRALVVGRGHGDDAEELAARGFDVTAFDVSPTAIEACRERFPDSRVDYRVADPFESPADWSLAFEFVLESYTLQVLPGPDRRRAIRRIADFVAPGGTLPVVTRGRGPDEAGGRLPWPLTRDTVLRFADEGLDLATFEDYHDDESPPVRRFRIAFQRPCRRPGRPRQSGVLRPVRSPGPRPPTPAPTEGPGRTYSHENVIRTGRYVRVMVSTGDTAPTFTATYNGSDHEEFELEAHLGDGPVVLAFFPGAFTPPCSSEMDAFQGHLERIEEAGATLFAVSADSPFSQAAFAAEYDLEFDLVSDMAGDAIDAYDLSIDIPELGLYGVANRAIYVIDDEVSVTYCWRADDPTTEPDYGAVIEAVEAA